MQAGDRIKHLALSLLPDGLLRPLKLRHYARVVRDAALDYEPDLQVLRFLVRSGDTAVDIGANIGVYTKHLSSLTGADGRLFSIEPVPLTFEILSSNVRRLHLANVNLFRVALSDHSGWSTMEIPKYARGGEDFYMARLVEEGRPTTFRTVRIELRTLDSLLPRSLPISFIKCDVEGHELKCLLGSLETIESWHPAWLIEVSGNPDQPDSNAARVMHLMQEHGYGIYRFDGSRLRPRRPGDHSVNYFFLTASHLEHLETSGLLT